ncbi:MAG: hypothetical protein OXU27_18520 [Candidatus Poribacteria bacterium]|nr:hypothetical protein [Candidatus Poribacteria bacterium]
MRNLFVLTIIIVVVIIGFAIHTELSTRKFIKDLPETPAEPLVRTQQQSPPDFESASRETKPTAEVLAETLERYEGGSSDQQKAPLEINGNPAVSLNQNAEPSQTPDPDWRNGDAFPQASSRDPWQQEDMSMKFVDWNTLSEQEQLSMAHKSLIKQFGDIPQVRAIIAFDNRPRELPTSIDEAIAHTEAALYLWPDEVTRQSLVQLKQLKADGFKEFPGAR